MNPQKTYAHLSDVLEALHRGETVMVQHPVKTRFRLEADRIRLNQSHFQSFLDWDTFIALYGHAIFSVIESHHEADIDPLKDGEYYAFKHK